jgi:hypothetical protein
MALAGSVRNQWATSVKQAAARIENRLRHFS